ncbi:ROK family protein [Nocardia sp. NPDC004068]|uniref:ROK family protein n=1 Tax=Nocardia sp. NPDC004068 TaxID=3364303 RepID=UPI0036C7A0DF
MPHRSWPVQRTGARQSTVRAANLALVLQTVLRAPEPLSRADIAGVTSMTRATAARWVDELVAGGVLAEGIPAQGGGRGRPATPIVAGRTFAGLGLQVNTTSLSGRVIALTGEVLAERVTTGDFRGGDPATVLATLDELCADLLSATADARVVGGVLAVPGLVDTSTGLLLTAPNLGWRDIAPVDYLESLAALLFSIGNEADLAARAVADLAPGRPAPLRDFFYVSGETGIGGAAVLGGEVITGRHGWAGEIGHITVDPTGPECPCGSSGCLELYAGQSQLLCAANLPVGTRPVALADRARGGDAAARAALDRAAWALSLALSAVVNLLDIPAVVLGGHLGELSEFLIPPVRAHLSTRVLSARWTTPEIIAGQPDSSLSATGAAYAALSDLIATPTDWLPERATDNAS